MEFTQMMLDPKWMKKVAFFAFVSVEIVLYVGIGVFLGNLLDGVFGSEPFLLIGLGILGLFLAFMKVFYLIRASKEKSS